MADATLDERTTVEETWMEVVVRERRFLSIQAIGFARLAGKMARRYQQSTIEAGRSRPWVKKCLLDLLQDAADVAFVRKECSGSS